MDGKPVVLKAPLFEFPSDADLARLRLNFEIMNLFNHDGILKAHALVPVGSSMVLVMDDFDAVSLEALISDSPPSLPLFFDIALQLTAALGNIHQAGVIHRHLSTSNILVNPQTGQVKISGFGTASRESREGQIALSVNLLEGNLFYMAPEQTGRMSRVVDYRSDLYALGAIFYEMLTGRPPFLAEDKLQLVHAHIASVPVPPFARNPAVPIMLSEIVLKLLAKNAEDRYQSAFGVETDLKWCRSHMAQLTLGTGERTFTLGSADVCDRFQIAQKLYGREKERQKLLDAFGRIRSGQSVLSLVSGSAGTGKSSLIAELQKPITRDAGYFVTGKFDQFQRDVPYRSLTQALHQLIGHLLAETTDNAEHWSHQIATALGPNGQVLVDVLPELERLIGPQPSLPSLPPAETQNRFRLALRNFMRACAQLTHPLVLFLDDLQWADAASLDLIQVLLSDPETSHLMLIGAYRDNEIGEGHPLHLILNNLATSGVAIESIVLNPLTTADLIQLLSDTLLQSAAEVAPLADLIQLKTSSNPFFVSVYLRSLHHSGLITFDAEAGRWRWNISGILETDMTTNVVELMSAKITELPPETGRLCQLAACIGSEFDLPTLATISQTTLADAADALRYAVEEGLLLPVRGAGENALSFTADSSTPPHQRRTYPTLGYHFLHDRVQQAAYILIPEQTLGSVHLSIGRLLLSVLSEQQRSDRIFEIVGHLNQGAALIEAASERRTLTLLNRQAGDRARASTAYAAALRNYQAAIKGLPDDIWDRGGEEYELALNLYLGAAESACLVGDNVQMDLWIEFVLSRARTLLDKVKAYEVRIQSLIARDLLLDAISTGADALALLGVRLSLYPSRKDILLNLLHTKAVMVRKSIPQIARMPAMTHPEMLAVMRIAGRILSVSYLCLPDFFAILVLIQARLSIRYGHAPESCYAFAAYAIVLVGVLGDIRGGAAIGQMAVELVGRLNCVREKPRAFYGFYAFVYHWTQSLQSSTAFLIEGYRAGLDVGDMEYAGWAAFSYASHLFFAGRDLSFVEREMDTYCASIQDMGQEVPLNKLRLFQQVVRNLTGQNADPLSLVGPDYDDKTILVRKTHANDLAEVFHIYMARTMLSYHWGHFDETIANVEQARPFLPNVPGLYIVSLLTFYEALARLGRATSNTRDTSSANRANMRRDLRQLRSTLRKWAAHCPGNYRNKHLLVEAEYLAFHGREKAALNAYEASMRLANEHGFLHEEALANELAGAFALRQGHERIAQSYLFHARYLYLRWGATAKVQQLDQEYARLLSNSNQRFRPVTPHGGKSLDVEGETLDLSSILKASTALSGEVILDRLLSKMMHIVIENAGATSGSFLLNIDGRLEIAASISLDGEVLISSASEKHDSSVFPASIVHYVMRAEESLVLNEALDDSRFGADPYLQQMRPRSILCAPVLNGGRLTGVLYLENRLNTQVFTQERLNLLTLLSGQIAVSIDNALLYKDLEQKVQSRTSEIVRQNEIIQQEKEKVDTLLLNILPFETAEELKVNGRARARRYEAVTVVFADIYRFTQLAESLSAEDLVCEIDQYFRAMDVIVGKFGMEKIKTIGDAYMYAGGLPTANPDHAVLAVRTALAMQAYLTEAARTVPSAAGGPGALQIRIGIHSGPVVAGVVGTRKFVYDLWGDTVVLAARMEQSSEVGRINISSATYALVREQFECVHRGKIAAKNKGLIDMYFVEREKTADAPGTTAVLSGAN